ncbi:hypothetical protein HK105_207002 [Polyrhizophydium stewartii]|uniref:Uncharacterized protein n=1 Tax=Polyrhizophydium stewartii TaxID=2732419 RepID=A0ABR4N1X8_9FUNG
MSAASASPAASTDSPAKQDLVVDGPDWTSVLLAVEVAVAVVAGFAILTILLVMVRRKLSRRHGGADPDAGDAGDAGSSSGGSLDELRRYQRALFYSRRDAFDPDPEALPPPPPAYGEAFAPPPSYRTRPSMSSLAPSMAQYRPAAPAGPASALPHAAVRRASLSSVALRAPRSAPLLPLSPAPSHPPSPSVPSPPMHGPPALRRPSAPALEARYGPAEPASP